MTFEFSADKGALRINDIAIPGAHLVDGENSWRWRDFFQGAEHLASEIKDFLLFMAFDDAPAITKQALEFDIHSDAANCDGIHNIHAARTIREIDNGLEPQDCQLKDLAGYLARKSPKLQLQIVANRANEKYILPVFAWMEKELSTHESNPEYSSVTFEHIRFALLFDQWQTNSNRPADHAVGPFLAGEIEHAKRLLALSAVAEDSESSQSKAIAEPKYFEFFRYSLERIEKLLRGLPFGEVSENHISLVLKMVEEHPRLRNVILDVERYPLLLFNVISHLDSRIGDHINQTQSVPDRLVTEMELILDACGPFKDAVAGLRAPYYLATNI